MPRIYLDNAATAPPAPEVIEAVSKTMGARPGDATAIHSPGKEAREALEKARAEVAGLLGCTPSELVFTASATEATNMVLRGLLPPGSRVITSALEEPATGVTLASLQDVEVVNLEVDENGRFDLESLSTALEEPADLVSLHAAQVDIGTIQDLVHVGMIAKKASVPLHLDGSQVVGNLPMDLGTWKADLLSWSAHKFHGPAGVGGLFISGGFDLPALITGAGQEGNRRSGSENIAGIVGTGVAANLAGAAIPDEAQEMATLRDQVLAEITRKVPDVRTFGHPQLRLPGHMALGFSGIEAAQLVAAMDAKGIAIATGGPALKTLGVDEIDRGGAIRVSMSRYNTGDEMGAFVDELIDSIDRQRAASPFW